MTPFRSLLKICLCSLIFQSASAQDTLQLDLPALVALAQSDAPDVLIAHTRAKNSYWYYQSILADYRPAIQVTGSLPSLNRSTDIVTQPNGVDQFVKRAQMRNQVGISLQQPITATGGLVFLASGIQRLDVFQDGGENLVSYFSTPLSIGLRQPLFGYNQLKWNKRIEPVRYQYATRQYAEEMENIAYQAAAHYFDLLIAQYEFEAAIQDKANADTLLRISEDRFEVGRIAESELLNARLQAMNAELAMQEATLLLQSSSERLRNFLGIKSKVAFKMIPPGEMPDVVLDEEILIDKALQNRSKKFEWDLQRLEAESAIARAKAQNGLQMDLYVLLSLSTTGDDLSKAYSNLLDDQLINLGITIPIFDWGKSRSRMETAQTNKELTLYTIEQEMVTFQQEIRLKAQQFSLLRNKVLRAQQAYELGLQRESMTRNRYLLGREDMVDLNVALQEKALARVNYLNALRDFWLAYYDLRLQTLYDFERGVSLIREPEH